MAPKTLTCLGCTRDCGEKLTLTPPVPIAPITAPCNLRGFPRAVADTDGLCGWTRWAKSRDAGAPYHRRYQATFPPPPRCESFAGLTVRAVGTLIATARPPGLSPARGRGGAVALCLRA